MSDPLGNARKQGMDGSLTGARGTEFLDRSGDDNLTPSVPTSSYGTSDYELIVVEPGAGDRVITPPGTMIRPFDCEDYKGDATPGTTQVFPGRDEIRSWSQQSPLYSSEKGKPNSALRAGAGNELETHVTPQGGQADGPHRFSKNDRV